MTSERLYLKSHEWITTEGDIATVGISDFAQAELGDIVFVEVPEIGRRVEKGEAVAVVESCKTAADVYAPASGEVVAVNEALAAAPELVNQGAMSEGWLFRLRLEEFDPASPEYLDEAAYNAASNA